MYVIQRKHFFQDFTSNSEANTSRLAGNLEEMLHCMNHGQNMCMDIVIKGL